MTRTKQYFKDLSKSLQTFTKTSVEKALFDHVDGYADKGAEELECERRDGFIPFAHNCGGLEVKTFVDLAYIYGGGNYPFHEKARAEIERQIELVREGYNTDIEEEQNAFYEALTGDENTIMYTVRVMYHGCENGIHSASVSAAVNTEGPYHRSSISWSPNTFCEGAKEVEISWRKDTAYKAKLIKALKQVTKEVF